MYDSAQKYLVMRAEQLAQQLLLTKIEQGSDLLSD